MKQQIEDLISRLASRGYVCSEHGSLNPDIHQEEIYKVGEKTYCDRCWQRHEEVTEVEWYTVPVLIGDVLAKLHKLEKTPYFTELISLWHYAGGLDKSLQSIFDSAEWEEQVMSDFKTETYRRLVPKQPHIRELFEFLIKLGL